MPLKFRLLQTETCHKGFFRLERHRLEHETFAGGTVGPLDRELLIRGPVVVVLPYDPVADRVVLLEQFRMGAFRDPEGAWLIEVVAGICESGETLEGVARRELLEETGCVGGRLERVCEFYASPGGSDEVATLFVAEIDSEGVGGVHGLGAEGEDIRVFVRDREDAWSAVRDGRIRVAPALIALQWLQLEHQSLRDRWASAKAPVRSERKRL